METLDQKGRSADQKMSELEQAVLDLVRVGTSGYPSGVRQLASRLVRKVPAEVQDPVQFRNELRKALEMGAGKTGLRMTSGDLPTSGEGTASLAHVDLVPRAEPPITNEATSHDLAEIVTERRRIADLVAAGIEPTATVLFVGNPGLGKTMAAQWVASELRLPLVTLDLATTISSYLGNTAKNIRAVFDYAREGECVLFLDEFDAIAKTREDQSDIGELKRIVNVVLLELDRWSGDSLLIAATNHFGLLDAAVERRFDRVVHFSLPDIETRRRILKAQSSNDLQVSSRIIEVLAVASGGRTPADIVRDWNIARRRAILNATTLEEELLRDALRSRSKDKAVRDHLWQTAATVLGISNRHIADLAGVTHPTVSAALARAKVPNG